MAGFIAPIIGGLAGLFGGGTQQTNKGTFSGQQHQTTSGSTTGSTSGSSTVNPNLSPLQQRLIAQFTGGAQNQYNQATDLSGYTAKGLQDINAGGDATSKAIANSLASRGLSYSPAAGTATAQQEIGRVGQQQSFLQGVPLLQRQLQQQALQQLIGSFTAIPTGVTSTSEGTTSGTTTGTSDSTSSGNQTGTIAGNPWAGAVSGVGAGLFGPNSSGTGNNLQAILNMLGFGKGSGGSNDGSYGPYGGG